ncbi:septum site-determining protein Ssd [Williamsia sp. M5A3_1d]
MTDHPSAPDRRSGPDQLLALVGADLRDDVARCAAAAGYQVVDATATTARRAWSEATAVVVDAAAARELIALGWPRRRCVLVVGPAEVDPGLWRAALTLGAEDGLVLPADEHAVVGALSRYRAPRRLAGAAVAILGGHGGAGASVLAAAVAARAADDLSGSALLLDLDELGGGIDLIFGLEDSAGLRWPDLTLDGGAVFADSLHAAVPHAAPGLALLCPRRGVDHRIGVDAAVAVIEAGRDSGDVVVVDLPRATDPVCRAVVECVDLVVVVTTATVRGCAAARDTVTRLRPVTDRLGLVVRGPAPGGLTASQIAAIVDIELLAALRPQRHVVGAIESGRLPLGRRSPLAAAADAVLDRVLDVAGLAA